MQVTSGRTSLHVPTAAAAASCTVVFTRWACSCSNNEHPMQASTVRRTSLTRSVEQHAPNTRGRCDELGSVPRAVSPPFVEP